MKKKFAGVFPALLLLLSLPSVAFASLPGGELSVWWAIPFGGILLSIALGPLLFTHFWHHNYGKVALGWAILAAVPLFLVFGVHTGSEAIAHAMLGDYVPFIIFVGALYIVAGGIHIRGSFMGRPLVNTLFLAIGAVLANFMGTTGAAMLLIRPLLSANADRRYQMHTFVFFIFIVANIAGSLTPLGDPPLFLGFLRGVSFFWTTEHLLLPMLTAVAILLALYFCVDTVLYNKEKKLDGFEDKVIQKAPFGIDGGLNFVWLACIIGAVLLSGIWKPGIEFTVLGVHLGLESLVRDGIFLLAGIFSLLMTKKEVREANQFNWEPILEVGKLFFGIFVTIVPVLEMLKAGSRGAFAPLVALVNTADGQPVNPMFFWLTGMLSSFLDNAPTYLAFFNLAGGDPQVLMQEVTTLMAISMGAVFMGANSYIGNAPNFMVVSIVQNRGVRMPSFFGYMAWSFGILIPLFLLLTWLFLM